MTDIEPTETVVVNQETPENEASTDVSADERDSVSSQEVVESEEKVIEDVKEFSFDDIPTEKASTSEPVEDVVEEKSAVVDEEQPKLPIFQSDGFEKWEQGVFICALICFEIFFCLFAFFLVKNGQDEFNKGANKGTPDPAFGLYYHLYIEVAVMIFLGFGLLMSFLKYFGYFAMAMSFLVAAVTIQYAIFCVGYSEIIVELIHHKSPHYYVILNLPLMIKSLFASGVTLISVGVLIGKLTPLQIMIMILLEIPVYAVNVGVVEGILEVSDVGGSMLVHTFGAYFGIFVSWLASKNVIRTPPTKQHSSRVTDVFSIVGTIALWILWPSFNGALEGTYQHRIAINTYMCLVACCISTFICSRLFRNGKFEMEDLQNATLAGGVAIGSAANMEFPVGVPVAVGLLTGVLSSVGYRWGSELLEMFWLHDTCGVNNLHGMPGILGAVVSIFASIGMKKELKWKEYQPLLQLAGICTTLIIATIGGLITGAIIRLLYVFYPSDHKNLYEDGLYFHVEDSEAGEEVIEGEEKKKGVNCCFFMKFFKGDKEEADKKNLVVEDDLELTQMKN